MVLCFGELLLRFAPDAENNWLEKNMMNVYLGGAEMNVASALAQWHVPISYLTVLPKNFLSDHLIKKINAQKIDTSTIIFNGNKIGTYYLLKGKEIQHAEVIYDRAHSSFADVKPGMIDWEKVLNGIRWFHFSAITPALSEGAAMVCEEALKTCVKKNIFISVDLNHRPKLWQYGKQANEIIPGLAEYCDVIMGNIWSAETMLNIPVQKNIHDINTKENYVNEARKASEKIAQHFTKCKIVANTFRFDKTGIEYYATVFSNKNFYVSSTYKTDAVIDKVGSGDSFMAGLIYGIYNNLPFQQVVNFAAAAAFQKLFIKGDCINKTAEEIKSFIQHHD